MRKTAVNFNIKELELITNLLRNHVEVAQYRADTFQAELAKRLEHIYYIAKEFSLDDFEDEE